MSDSPKADEARDDFILQERLSGRSARSISKELHCPVSEIDESLDRTLPKITNDAQAGLLVVKILERKAALLGLDSPQKRDVVQVQAQQQPSSFEKIHEAI